MKRGILVLLISLGLPFLLQINAQAQTGSGDDVQKITLNEAIDIALENNYQLKVAKNNLELAKHQVLSEKGDFLPSLNGSLSGNRREGNQFIPGSDVFVNTVVKGFNGSVRTSLPIFAGFQNINSLRSSRVDVESKEENLQRVRETVIFQTVSSYLQVLLDKKLLEIDRENLATSQKTLEQVKAQVEVGSRPTVDLYNQESTVANNELQVVNSENALQISRIQLIRDLQVDPLKNYEFTIPDVQPEDVGGMEYNLDELVRIALENRSDLKRDELTIESLRYQLKVTKASVYPSVDMFGSISSDASDQSDFDFNDQFFDQNVVKNIGFTLNIPLFNNFDRRTNIQAQEISYRNASLNLQDTELQIIQEVNQAITDYQSFIKQLEASEKALRAARRSYETEQERYNVGAGTLIELSDANAQFVEAQSNRAQALFRIMFQEKLLDYYLGKLEEDITLN